MTDYTYQIYAHGHPITNAEKDKRSLSWSPLQFVPFYIEENETVRIIVSGEITGNFSAVIGLPSDSVELSIYLLVEGENVFVAKKNGLLSFINYNETDDVFIYINSSHKRVPYFKLHFNSNNDWDEEMRRYSDAPYVILSNNFSDIVVTYNSANEYIKNAHELMMDNERIIEVENNVSGYVENGKADYRLDKNRCLHLEVDEMYMFATHGYTGYNEKNGAMLELLGPSSDRWGVWHENGHQRQQSLWQWDNLTEVTVNIYSLYVQENLIGRATRLDSVYSEINDFIEKEIKSYDPEDLFVKLGLFWQLHLAFGEQFYPQLHQIYRRMHKASSGPDADSDSEAQKQLFIITTSHLVNIDLTPFFTKWGVYPDLKTIMHLSLLPKLTVPIWLNDNDDHYSLPLPESIYIPELLYLKGSIQNVNLTKSNISFTIDSEWYEPYQYMFMVNGVYEAEVNGGIAYYCNSTLTHEGYHISLDINYDLSESDIFSVEISDFSNGVVHLSSMELNDLWDDVKSIYANEHLTILRDDIDQHILDELWQRHEDCENEHINKIKDKLLLAQQLLLQNCLKTDIYHDNEYIIEFSDESFKDYDFLIYANEQLLSRLTGGEVELTGSINENSWSIPVDNNKIIDIMVNINGHGFLVRKAYTDSFDISDEIEALYIDKENEIIKGSVDQNEINGLHNAILNNDFPHWAKASLINELHNVQRLYLLGTVSDAYVDKQIVNVFFQDDLIFHNYRYMLFSNEEYISEVSYGQNYYSSLDNQLWKTGLKESQLGSLRIVAYVNNFWHTVYVFAD